MASRASTPLRIAAQHLRLAHRSPRTFASAATPKTSTYSKTLPSSRTAATATASKPSPTKPAAASPAAPAKKTLVRKIEPAGHHVPNPAAEAPAPGQATHRRIPQVSGKPLPDAPPTQNDAGSPIDWASSFHGLGTSTFDPEVASLLQAPLEADDIEVKPDGILYLPEIKYRRVLNAAFGPGGWGLAPRGELVVTERIVYRDYALVAHGRFVGQARGEMQYFSDDGISTAAEGCKSNALMRCCKDLGIASELWDPRFIRKFMREHAHQVWVEHATSKKRKQIWLRKDDEIRYPYKKTTL
ncbi:uncharacterized protein JN550_004617 [Neoarthrinium moseri]|uniref:uncharacterized protein n=1 Tax=Neoarthrinium moseri TaxID=1658444 RepID=UPI001FDCA921|nr:uncharacterized protein JN550_004617 [Neoarthrinium moseri]KAI1871172.1 hypothetical protein JN550_004617 [Neoarthrinium moseri]